MKISKRILGVAIALIMIFNVFAVGTFAAYPSDTLISLGMTIDKPVYAPGDTITITFNAECLPELGRLAVGGQYEIGYNSAVLEPSSTDTQDLEKHGFVGIQEGAALGSASIQMPAGSSGPSPLYDWDTAITYCFGDNAATFDATSRVDLFSIDMVVKADAPDGTYTIGFNPVGYEEFNAYINDGGDGLYGLSASDYGYSVPNLFDFGTVTFTVSSAPAVEVYHNGTQARYAYPGTPSADAYQFGFVGGVSGLIPVTELVDGHNNVTNIRSIEAIGTYQGKVAKAEVKTMWLDDNGDYGFRAVFAEFDYRATDEITINFVITMEDGTTTYATAEAATDTPNGIYLAAVGRNMPAIPEIA